MSSLSFAFSSSLTLTAQRPCLTGSISLRHKVTQNRVARARGVIRMGPVEHVTGKQLEEAVRSCNKPMLIDIYAKWCGPCQFLLPQLDILAERMGDRLRILKMDCDEEERHAQALGVRGLPTLMLVAGGECRFRMEGALTAEDLEELVNHYFFGGPKPAFFAKPVEELSTDN